MNSQAEMHRDLILQWATDGLVANHAHAEDAARFQARQNLSQWVGYNVHEEKAKWVTAFRAYESALSQPYFDQDLAQRKQNDTEVHETFLALKRLAEET